MTSANGRTWREKGVGCQDDAIASYIIEWTGGDSLLRNSITDDDEMKNQGPRQGRKNGRAGSHADTWRVIIYRTGGKNEPLRVI